MDPRVERMAQVLVNYCVDVKKGQWVVIQSPVLGAPLAEACQRAVLRAGGYPTVVLGTDSLQAGFLKNANDEQLSFVSPVTRVVTEQADARIAVRAPSNTRAMSSVDPAQTAKWSKAMEPLGALSMRRAAEGTYHWTVCQFPTEASAQDAGMSLEDYENFVYNACLLDRDDPVTAWDALKTRQQGLIDWISDKSVVHITGPGTDLTVNVGGRTWINDGGTANFPGGEIFTGPVEDATEGTIQFSFPAFLGGNEVSGVRLRFEKGRVVEASATAGNDFLQAMLNMDDGARVLGEFAFGTNNGIQRFTKNTLFDEKIGGTLHMALGRAYPETGGKNESGLHWDMVYDLAEAEVTVDGQPFSRNGRFAI